MRPVHCGDLNTFFFSANFETKILADFSNFSPNFFGPKLAEMFFFIKQCCFGFVQERLQLFLAETGLGEFHSCFSCSPVSFSLEQIEFSETLNTKGLRLLPYTSFLRSTVVLLPRRESTTIVVFSKMFKTGANLLNFFSNLLNFRSKKKLDLLPLYF